MPLENKGENNPLDQVAIPLYGEDVSIGKKQVATGQVKVSTVTHSREELIEQLLQSERVQVDRVPVGQIVDNAPEVRTEGDTTIIPVVEETVVLQRKLVLKEEFAFDEFAKPKTTGKTWCCASKRQ